MPRSKSPAEWIRARLKKKKLTQAELAARLGIDRTYVNKWARGKITPEEPRHLAGLARELGGKPADYAKQPGGPLEARVVMLELRLDGLERLVEEEIAKRTGSAGEAPDG